MTDLGLSAAAPTPDALAAGRSALARHAWPEAFERLSEADRLGELSGSDLEDLALSAFFVGEAAAGEDAKERAFKRYEAVGDTARAAMVAVDIARNLGFQGKRSIASAWKGRAERLVGRDGDTPVHGFLALAESEGATVSGDLDEALERAERAVAIGATADNPDLFASAQVNLGALKIATGATEDGFALMEEASIAAVSGDLSPMTSGITACRMIGACRDLTDYRRASEWIEATEKYCDRQSLDGFPGVCRVHRAEVRAVSGDWQQAETELKRATVELAAFHATPPQADGFYAIGDIRRLRGDFDGAEEALREAHARGRSPQPALALIRLAQGNLEAAVKAIKAAVAEQTWDQWARARLLPAQIEIALAAGDVAGARAAVDELASIVSGYPSPALEASRRTALGRVLLAERDADSAVRELRSATKLWRDVGAPFEVARVRFILSRALRALDDEDGADLELRAAIDEFQRLGAAVDLEAATRELRASTDRRTGPRTARKTFMFTDIVGSTNLAEALGDVAWERLLRWHDDELRRLVADGGGRIVNSTGDGFFAAFDDARPAIDTAIAIQRALADHRESSGFALGVRIGLHAAEATQRGDDYSGMAVHVASRIGGLGQAGEIVASTATVAEAGGVANDERLVPVKGVSAPISVATIAWS